MCVLFLEETQLAPKLTKPSYQFLLQGESKQQAYYLFK